MLRFKTDSSKSGERIVNAQLVSGLFLTPYVGATVPAYWPDHRMETLRTERSRYDSLITAPQQQLGLHSCHHCQIDGDVILPACPSGPYIDTYDPLYGINTSQLLEPQGPCEYSLDELYTIPVGEYRYWQQSSAQFTWTNDRRLPFLTSGGVWEKGWGARRTPTAFLSSLAITGIRVLPCPQQDYQAVSMLTVGLSHWIYLDGSTWYFTCSAAHRIYTFCPKSDGGSTGYLHYLSSTNQWSTTSSYYTLPNSLASSPSVEEVYRYAVCPSRALARTGLDLVSIPTPYTWAPTFNPPQKISLVPVSVDWESVCNEVASLQGDAVRRAKKADLDVAWDELGDSAADNIKSVCINSLAYILQANQVFGTVRETLSLLSNIKDPTEWASWWLSLRYGDKLTFRDTSSLIRAAGSELRKLSTGWRTSFYKTHSKTTLACPPDPLGLVATEGTASLVLYYRPRFKGAFPSFYRFMDQWDLWPSLTNAWDLIPFSFVVDWFVDVQSAFETIDRDNRLLMNDVLAVCSSTKVVHHVGGSASQGVVLSDWTLTIYNRSITNSLPTSPFRMERGHLSAINVVDGISLLFAG